MKYYKVLKEFDPKIVGRIGGSQCYGEPLIDSYSYEFLFGNECNRQYPESMDIRCLILDTKAKITDFLSIGGQLCGGMLMSDNAKSIINRGVLPPLHGFYSCFINKSQLCVRMTYLGIFDELCEKIDFERTYFRVYESVFSKDFEVVQFENIECLLIRFSSVAGLGKITPDGKYQFLKGMPDYDIFRIGKFDFSLYVSEFMKNAIESENLTGLTFVETSFF